MSSQHMSDNDAQLLKSVGAFLERQYGLLEECQETESPIEAMLYFALSIVGEFQDGFYLSIKSQEKMGEYRADFLVTLIPRFPEHSSRDRCAYCSKLKPESNRRKKYCSKACYLWSQAEHARKPTAAIVECDGHDFHEKTKAQAKRDKKRDRFIQAQGFHVLHFTGSEVWNDAIACAEEIVKFLREKWAAS